MLIVCGKNDPLFTVEGAEAYQGDLANAEIHILDIGHFALAEEGDCIGGLIKSFFLANKDEQNGDAMTKEYGAAGE
jgi:pimeloyl-ACP methyl ester carboxylesterase